MPNNPMSHEDDQIEDLKAVYGLVRQARNHPSSE
jgi:hypothetical protein